VISRDSTFKLALDAHGGLTRWRQVESIDLKLSIGEQPWHAKGLPQGLNVGLRVEPGISSPRSSQCACGYSPFQPWNDAWALLKKCAPKPWLLCPIL